MPQCGVIALDLAIKACGIGIFLIVVAPEFDSWGFSPLQSGPLVGDRTLAAGLSRTFAPGWGALAGRVVHVVGCAGERVLSGAALSTCTFAAIVPVRCSVPCVFRLLARSAGGGAANAVGVVVGDGVRPRP